jgi:Lrp/AsnC family leucine-responsive transcriptional regulator
MFIAGGIRKGEDMARLDDINREILDILQHDSSITNQELASRVGLAPASTLERVKKLEAAGVIRAHVALVDEKLVDKHIKAFIFVTMKEHSSLVMKSFNSRITSLPEVMECHRLAGEKDYLLKVICDNIEDFEEFTRERLTTIPGIDKTSSTIVLSTIAEKTAISLTPARTERGDG